VFTLGKTANLAMAIIKKKTGKRGRIEESVEGEEETFRNG